MPDINLKPSMENFLFNLLSPCGLCYEWPEKVGAFDA